MEIQLRDVIYAVAGFLCVYSLKQLTESVKEAIKSIKELNEKVAVIIERTETHGHEINFLREKQDNISNDVAQIKAKLQVIKE